MIFVASCLFGMEKFVAEDIDSLGYRRIETIDGRVTFEAPEDAVARCNVFFRYAERLFIRVGVFDAESFDDLFEGVKNIPWADYIGRDDSFPVKGHCIKSKLFSVPDCQKIVKKAIVEKLKENYRISIYPENGKKVQIEFFILRDKAVIMIDTSGVGLHKRGYRLDSNEAPLRETLAAALVKLARPRENVIFVDPLCGSGTLPIEAALLVTNTAPGLQRTFSGEQLPFLDSRMWAKAREEAHSLVKPWNGQIFGSDIDSACIAISKRNALRAGVEQMIHFSVSDVKAFSSPIPGARGTIVANPPYGERMSDRETAERLYADMGKRFKTVIPDWHIYILTCNEMFERFYGRRADKMRKLYNGMIPCIYFQFFKK